MYGLARGYDPALTAKQVYPSVCLASGNGPAPQVAVAVPPFTRTVRPARLEQPPPFTAALARRQTLAERVAPQPMPAGLEVTVPAGRRPDGASGARALDR